jgi:hypothetical protein
VSTFVELLPRTLEGEVVEPALEVVERESLAVPVGKDALDSFEEEQLRGLVQQVFLTDNPKPCRQVIFSPVDPQSGGRSMCRRIGGALSHHVSGMVCVVECVSFPQGSVTGAAAASRQRHFGTLRDSAEQLSPNLWFMPAAVFVGDSKNHLSAAWLRGRLAELRLEFDYTVIAGPAASSSEGSMLAALCDGMVLVIEANCTRRAAAQKVRRALSAGNIRLLGTVLSERTFPIPEALYRRL